ncbi:MAG: DUF6624 domain-containing protein [Gemmataceae bacterium]
MAVLLTWLVLASDMTAGAAEPGKGEASASNEALRKELIQMEKVDQAARSAMMKALGEQGISFAGGKPITDLKALAVLAEETRKLGKVDAAHRVRLKAIVEKHGWPGKSLVGSDGAHAAWLLVQHADADRKFQAQCLRLMEAAAPGEVAGKDIAYLTDRVLVGERKPQRYGTQLGADFKPLPIEDEKQVDVRRAALGLPPLAEYVKTTKAEYEKLAGKGADKK